MHSKLALFQGPRSSSVLESKETKEVSVGTGIKDRFEWEVQAFWENNATLKPVEHCCILVKHFQHNESVEKTSDLVPLEWVGCHLNVCGVVPNTHLHRLWPTLQNSPQSAIMISSKIREAQQDVFEGDVESGKEQEELIL